MKKIQRRVASDEDKVLMLETSECGTFLHILCKIGHIN